MANALWYGLSEFRIDGWFDYVESESNGADGGYRVGLSDSRAADLNVRQLPLPPFQLPSDFPFTQPDAWVEWWRAARTRSVTFLSG